uniref:Uncharacterized protein n=1 Tax=Lepeophtheirus salmonis TaxID=72036 RepID=A0A0K2TWG0_LEPSM
MEFQGSQECSRNWSPRPWNF